MEIDKDFKVPIKLVDFIELNSYKKYPSIEDNVSFRISIFDIMQYTNKDYLKQVIQGIHDFGFRIVLNKFLTTNLLDITGFSLYWKTFGICKFNWGPRAIYTSFDDYIIEDTYPDDLLNGIFKKFHRNVVLFVLLMARCEKNKNLVNCYLGKLPSDLIKYIYFYNV